MITGSRSDTRVLLVLENADARLGRGGDAWDRLVDHLDYLCSMGEGERLKLLVTSEQELLPGAQGSFRNSSEVEAKVEPLKPWDASLLMMDNLPRHFNRSEVGLPNSVPLTKENIIYAVQNHPHFMDVIRQGYPGALVRESERGLVCC